MTKILHIYHDLMSLYGDWANAEVLAMELRTRGHETVIDKKSIGAEVDFGAYDFLYIGSGTERSVLACLNDIRPRKEALLKRIEEGMHVLATGNSHEIFGKAITGTDGTRHEALGLLNFETTQGNTRTTGDCVIKASFIPEKLIGFINRAGIGQSGNTDRPFQLELGAGSSDKSKEEGILYNNLLGTYITGPVLVRNPPLLKYFADKLLGGESKPQIEDGACADEKPSSGGQGSQSFGFFADAAYGKALKELSNRASQSS
ncbi:MAG: hypothetical protein FWB75_01915 [Oscillospiraceae bacterium]|nr:hypothetical protein [Oscillospiraceae bacterium]